MKYLPYVLTFRHLELEFESNFDFPREHYWCDRQDGSQDLEFNAEVLLHNGCVIDTLANCSNEFIL